MTVTVPGPFIAATPDDGYFPAKIHEEALPVGALLVTMYNHEKSAAAVPPYDPRDFNPNPVKVDSPKERGRFTAVPRNADQYASKYFGRKRRNQDERLSIWETLTFENVGVDPNGTLVIPPDNLKPYSLLYVRVIRKQQLVRLTNQNEATALRADIRAIQGTDFKITRAWARWIRKRRRKTDGIMYHPARYGSTDKAGPAIVLFEDLPHSTAANSKARPRPYYQVRRVRLMSKRGQRILRRALKGVDFVLG